MTTERRRADILRAALLRGLAAAAVGTVVLHGCGFSPPPSYAADVAPILEQRCLECHRPGGVGYERSGLDMRSYESLMKGTKFGRVVVPGDTIGSVLLQLVEHRVDPSLDMPHGRAKLPQREIDVLEKWIEQGAKP